MSISHFPLIDGALMTNHARTQELVTRMAQDLIRFGAVHDERDAVRALAWCGGYSVFDVVRLVPDARQVAMQEIVAKEMGKS